MVWLFRYRDACIGNAQKHAKSIPIYTYTVYMTHSQHVKSIQKNRAIRNADTCISLPPVSANN